MIIRNITSRIDGPTEAEFINTVMNQVKAARAFKFVLVGNKDIDFI